jgi:succinate-semialdehyde dehydrogenase/glutarate-semialdehyde dehydrogenase
MKMLIGGQFRNASNNACKDDINPATGEVIDTYPLATPEDVQETLENARKGFLEWSNTALYKRLQILYKYADLLEENKDELTKLMCRESGKSITKCRSEAAEAIIVFRQYCEQARNFMGESFPLDTEPRCENDLIVTLHQPLGVIVCIVPFNFPIELYAHKVAPALVTGNAVIIKPASDTPCQNIFMTELLLKAGVPGNAAQIVTGSGATVGAQLTKSKLIDAVSLTGSTEVGIEIMKNCAENIHHVGLELGGNDPLIIFADCDLDRAVSETFVGRLSNAGQTCCASKRFIVQNTVKDKYIEKMIEALKHVHVGDPFDEKNHYGPLISEKAAKEVEQQINHTISQGAKCAFGGKRFDKTFIEPTLLVDVTPEMDIARAMEVFGPVMPVIGFDTVDEAIEIANNIPYGLQSGVMTADMKTAFKVAKAMQCGCCVINGSGNYRSAHQAFGGWKMTGLGREGIAYTLEEMTQVKTIALKGLFAK